MDHRRRFRISVALAIACFFFLRPLGALAHDVPDDGAEWIMADWMLLAFLTFFSAALIAFLVASRRGLLSKVEESKYFLLDIDEPDYYTPDWAREDADATAR